MEVRVDNCPVEMEIDTGAGLSLVSEATFRKTWTDRSIEPSKVRLCSYSGGPIPVAGEVIYSNHQLQAAAGQGTACDRPKCWPKPVQKELA